MSPEHTNPVHDPPGTRTSTLSAITENLSLSSFSQYEANSMDGNSTNAHNIRMADLNHSTVNTNARSIFSTQSTSSNSSSPSNAASGNTFNNSPLSATISSSSFHNHKSATLATLSPYIDMLYTYRPLSSTILPIERNADAHTKAIVYREIFDLLEGNIRELDGFVRVLVECVRVEIAPLVQMVGSNLNQKGGAPPPASSNASLPQSLFVYSDYFFSNVAKIMDIFCQLNLIKSFKNSLSLDFTMYKRAFTFMRRDGLDDEALLRIQELTEYSPLFQFIADKQAVRNVLLDELKPIRAHFDVLLTRLIQYCTRILSAELYTVPEEKYSLLRVLIFSLTLLSDHADSKSLPATDISKLVKRYPVLPLYGDISFNCINTLSKLHILPKNLWEIRDERQLETLYLVEGYIDEYEAEYNTLISEYSSLNVRIKYLQREDSRKMSEMPQEIKTQIMHIVKRALQLMSKAKMRIMEQSAWKFSHPCSEERVKEILGEKRFETIMSQTNMEKQQDDDMASLEFDRVMRYNYTHEERSHLLRIVALLKSLQDLLLKNGVQYSRVIRGEIYAEIQQFCRSTMADHIFRAQKRQAKKKREYLLELLLMLQQCFADGNTVPPAKRGKNMPPDKVTLIQHDAPAPSLEQLNFGEDVLSILVQEDRPGTKKSGLFSKKDFKERQLAELKEFYNSFRQYRYLLDLDTTVRSIGDLSHLYFKEFNFEITQRVWFPVKASLGYMLIKSIMSHCDERVEKILSILHIYHDAAHRALFVIRKRHLFEEVKAELQLCLEYLTFKMSERIFQHYKEKACAQLLQEHNVASSTRPRPRASSHGKRMTSSHQKTPAGPADFTRLMQTKAFPLLDSTFNLHEVLSSRITDLLVNNLRLALSTFESQPITHIHSLEQMLKSIELTHSFLNEHLSLPPYQQLLAQADERSSHTSMDGRIMNHIISEVCFFITQEMVFDLNTHQFQPAELLVCQELNSYERAAPPTLEKMYAFGTERMNTLFHKITEPNQHYFGREHVECLQRLCGNALWPLVADAAFEFIQERLLREVHLFVKELFKALPARSRLPNALKLSQLFYYIDTRFRDFRSYEGMPEALHCFRLIGNVLAFILLLDSTMESVAVFQRLRMAPFLDLKPIGEVQRTLRRAERKKLEQQEHYIAAMNAPPLDRTPLMQDLLKNVPESPEDEDNLAQQVYDTLSLAEQSAGTSMFSHLLCRLADETLVGEFGKFLCGEDSLSHIDNSPSFFKLWTVLEYFFYRKSYVVTISGKENTHEEKRLGYSRIFGDGVLMCSLTVIHLLRHRFRFESFNFLNHIANLKTISDEAITEPELQSFLDGITQNIFKTQLLFSIFHSHYEVQHSFEEFAPPSNLDFNVVQSIPRSPEVANSFASPIVKQSPVVSLNLSIDSSHPRAEVNDLPFVDEDSFTDTSILSSARININLAEDFVEDSSHRQEEDESEDHHESAKDSDNDHEKSERDDAQEEDPVAVGVSEVQEQEEIHSEHSASADEGENQPEEVDAPLEEAPAHQEEAIVEKSEKSFEAHEDQVAEPDENVQHAPNGKMHVNSEVQEEIAEQAAADVNADAEAEQIAIDQNDEFGASATHEEGVIPAASMESEVVPLGKSPESEEHENAESKSDVDEPSEQVEEQQEEEEQSQQVEEQTNYIEEVVDAPQPEEESAEEDISEVPPSAVETPLEEEQVAEAPVGEESPESTHDAPVENDAQPLQEESPEEPADEQVPNTNDEVVSKEDSEKDTKEEIEEADDEPEESEEESESRVSVLA